MVLPEFSDNLEYLQVATECTCIFSSSIYHANEFLQLNVTASSRSPCTMQMNSGGVHIMSGSTIDLMCIAMESWDTGEHGSWITATCTAELAFSV
jgi:hypothetical protein